MVAVIFAVRSEPVRSAISPSSPRADRAAWPRRHSGPRSPLFRRRRSRHPRARVLCDRVPRREATLRMGGDFARAPFPSRSANSGDLLHCRQMPWPRRVTPNRPSHDAGYDFPTRSGREAHDLVCSPVLPNPAARQSGTRRWRRTSLLLDCGPRPSSGADARREPCLASTRSLLNGNDFHLDHW